MVDSFRSHGFRGPIQEFEYLTSALFHRDPAARAQIVAGRAFSVAFETQFDPVPEGFVWRTVEPEPLIPVDMFWRPAASPVARTFVHLAREVAESHEWLTRSVIPAH